MTLARPLFAVALTAALAVPARGQDVNEAAEKAMKAAALKAAPCVVKIETAGGSEVVGGGGPAGPGRPPAPGIRKGTGPTTGLVVAPDGYVISSAFNFAHKPTDIFVTVPGRPTRLVGKIVATDQTRMLTLLKVEAADLPMPAIFPKKDVQVGQWSLALGRTLDPSPDHPPSVSAGIVSAVNRIWGKAIQTDCKVSPVNYGGPLVAIDGRVLGVLVPASARGEGETAGVEWYDSGIGFAVPLEDVLAAVPRLREGKDLRRGLLGITPQGSDVYGAAPVIGSVMPDSAAARIGLKVGDKILKLDKKPVPNYSAVMHVLGPKYDGDVIEVVVERGGKEIVHDGVTLQGTMTAYVNPFLGILPMRDDPEPGVEVRYVYPKSPADEAGVKPGDRILKIGLTKDAPLAPVTNRGQFAAAVARLTPGTELRMEVKRKGGDKTETVTAKLGTVGDTLPDKVPPLPSSVGKALEKPKGPAAPKVEPKKIEPPKKGPEPKKPETGLSFAAEDPPAKKAEEPKKDDAKDEVETGLLKRTNEALGRDYWVYVPRTYKKDVSHGLIVWFHAAGKGGKDADSMRDIWQDFCDDHHFILVGPKSQNADGWVASETEAVMQDVQAVMKEFTVDRSRVIAHGMGVGGQMAFYVGFNARDVFRGVAAVGAALGNPPKDNAANQPLSFFITAGDKDPIIKDIREGKAALDEKKFPVVYREMKEAGKEYLDQKTFDELVAWMDSLDRI